MESKEIESSLNRIKGKQTELEENAKQFQQNINKDYKFLDEQLSKLQSQKKELKELKELLAKEQLVAYKKELHELEQSIQRIHDKLAPRTGSLFVRLFLGKVNVKQYREGERVILKQEYQKFKRRTDPLFLLLVIAQLILRARAVEILFQVWLLYYYVTLALRENILKVNGSNIKEWWIIHHYLSIGVSLTIVTWPAESQNYARFLPQFLYFCLGQGVVQMLQTRYQSAKLYKLVAMGKAGTMDVPGETGSWSDFGLTPFVIVLLPFLLFVQFFQLYNSYTLLNLAFNAEVEWEVIACGILFFALGVGNLGTTIYTYKQKFSHNKTE